MNISSRQLKAFVLTARHQSFSRAAEQLFITQSGMSVLVRELEAQLGFRLFERTTRKVELTPAGAQFLPIAERNLGELEAVAASLNRSAAAANGRVSIGAAPFPAAEIMPQAIGAYATLNPRAQIRMIDAERPRLLELVQSGKIDAALLTDSEHDLAGMRKTLLARFALMLIAPAQGMRALPLEVRWTDIAGLRLIGLPHGFPIQQLVDAQLARAGRAAPVDMTCNYLETQIAMVEAGAGAGVTPGSAAPACAKRNVTMHALFDPVVWTELCWVSSRSRELSTGAESFGEFLRSYFAQIADQGPRPQGAAAARAA